MDDKKVAYIYGNAIQGGAKIELSNKFAKDGKIFNLFGRYHITEDDISKAGAMLSDKVLDLISEGYKVKLVLVGFSPLVAVMYGWYVLNKKSLSDDVVAVYYIREIGEKNWKEVKL